MAASTINNLVVISDIHAGCRTSLVPPEGFRMDGGGTYKPSAIQRKMWKMWREFWDEWVPFATRNEPYAVLFNGDSVEGVHHGSNSQWTANMEDQRRCAEAILRPVVDNAARYYHVRGTDCHVGPSGQDEENLARNLGAHPNEHGQHARYDLWVRVGKYLGHCLHHIGTTSSQANEAAALHKEYVEELIEAARWGEPPPDWIIRSHRHRNIMTTCPTDNGHAIAAATPCWQGKSSYVWRIAGGRTSQPQWGGLLVRQSDTDEELFIRPKVWTIKRSRVEI